MIVARVCASSDPANPNTAGTVVYLCQDTHIFEHELLSVSKLLLPGCQHCAQKWSQNIHNDLIFSPQTT